MLLFVWIAHIHQLEWSFFDMALVIIIVPCLSSVFKHCHYILFWYSQMLELLRSSFVVFHIAVACLNMMTVTEIFIFILQRPMAGPNMITITRSEKYSAFVGKQLMSMKEDGSFSDFGITVNEKTFPCHKLMLAVHSPVLRAMMKSDMVEAAKQSASLDDIRQRLWISYWSLCMQNRWPSTRTS